MDLNPLNSVFELGKSVIERIWPDENKRAEEMRKLEEMRQNGGLKELELHVQLLLAQLKVNEREAQHKSIFVAGWRPFVGWVGGLGLAYVGFIYPIMKFVAMMFGYSGEFPEVDTSATIPVLLGMLGVGTMRSVDKKNGVETTNVGGKK